jgi:hypothetical protein
MKLLDQAWQLARVKHFSYRTEQAYAYWIELLIRHHGNLYFDSTVAADVEALLTHRAVDGNDSVRANETKFNSDLINAVGVGLPPFGPIPTIARPLRPPMEASIPSNSPCPPLQSASRTRRRFRLHFPIHCREFMRTPRGRRHGRRGA